MTIEEIKNMLEKKIKTLIEQKNIAYQSGDLEEYNRIDSELKETELTLKNI